ncbi:hypothetical protein TNCV_336231 [Trichonephila clavipes]|nr:hypothetical protein TNCV_336231 [Trichonephila clavipes]
MLKVSMSLTLTATPGDFDVCNIRSLQSLMKNRDRESLARDRIFWASHRSKTICSLAENQKVHYEDVNQSVAVSNPLGAGKPKPSPFDLSPKECRKPGLDLKTTVPGKCPSSPEDKQEKQGENTDKERLNRLHKGRTTQVTASKVPNAI